MRGKIKATITTTSTRFQNMPVIPMDYLPRLNGVLKYHREHPQMTTRERIEDFKILILDIRNDLYDISNDYNDKIVNYTEKKLIPNIENRINSLELESNQKPKQKYQNNDSYIAPTKENINILKKVYKAFTLDYFDEERMSFEMFKKNMFSRKGEIAKEVTFFFQDHIKQNEKYYILRQFKIIFNSFEYSKFTKERLLIPHPSQNKNIASNKQEKIDRIIKLLT